MMLCVIVIDIGNKANIFHIILVMACDNYMDEIQNVSHILSEIISFYGNFSCFYLKCHPSIIKNDM